MTPSARIQSAIELLSLIEAGSEPTDHIVGRFLRERRFIGAKDRRAIGDLVYGVLRARARLDWWRIRQGGDATFDEDLETSRQRVIAFLALDQGAEAAAALFDGSTYGPAPISAEEGAFLQAVDGQSLCHAEQPDWVRLEMPEWLLPMFRSSLGDGVEQELAALGAPATLDLRVNRLKADREAARRALAAEGIEATPTPYSPLGLRLTGRVTLPAVAAFRDGLIEVQDEGSQIVALLCDARPGMAVADLCAGGGGKTLALAAGMAGKGRLAALDIDAGRLARARPRLARAGAEWVEIRPLAGRDDPWFEPQAGAFDRVLVDAPCSGSGTWRRDPVARWRLTPTDLGRYRDLQRLVLSLAGPLVKSGGRLIYATCSLLEGENQDQAAWFLAQHSGFRPLSPEPLWSAAGLGGTCPVAESGLQLTPARHGTDGFYCMLVERAA